jgi:hypothetical protein
VIVEAPRPRPRLPSGWLRDEQAAEVQPYPPLPSAHLLRRAILYSDYARTVADLGQHEAAAIFSARAELAAWHAAHFAARLGT